MENMARLAVLELKLGTQKFHEVFKELSEIISSTIHDPNDEYGRKTTNSILPKVYDCVEFCDYMKYIGYEKISNQYIFPKGASVSKLEMARAAIDKKLNYIQRSDYGTSPGTPVLPRTQEAFEQYQLKMQRNPFLLRIQSLFNTMQIYEDKDLQEEARRHIPLTKLQVKAMERMREHQKKIKAGETKIPDMAFEIALLMELLGWFKYEFFQWVDKPECDGCKSPTTLATVLDNKHFESEICRVEVYKCQRCSNVVNFPRLNNPRSLLRTRRGRCGEWANCFTLLCRALEYETRFVHDVTDHVWCEVYDISSSSWLHVDPCEGALDTPLMYCHGWGKQLSYVFAFSRHDLQDVTWRYTTNHKEVLSRRTSASEADVLHTILYLRAQSHQRLSPARQRFLTIRNIAELASLMVEKTPSDYESRGRISGSSEWRAGRGEMGSSGHAFLFSAPGEVRVHYCTSTDRYRVTGPEDDSELVTWLAGARDSKSVFRKVEQDWRQVYLARSENEEIGSVSWQIKTETAGLRFSHLAVGLSCAVYETGRVDWSVQFDDEPPETIPCSESVLLFERSFRSATLRAELSGGLGDVAWQHAQLFRQSLDDKSPVLEIRARLAAE